MESMLTVQNFSSAAEIPNVTAVLLKRGLSTEEVQKNGWQLAKAIEVV